MRPHEGVAARQSVVTLVEQGHSIWTIAWILQKSVKFVRGVPIALIVGCHVFPIFLGITDKLKAGKDPLKRVAGSGRPRKTTKREDRTIVKLIRKKPFSALPPLIKDGEIVKISRHTISRCLREVFFSTYKVTLTLFFCCRLG